MTFNKTECVSDCEYALLIKTMKQILLIQDGCIHCKHRITSDECEIGWCPNYEKFDLDINKVIENYELKDCEFQKGINREF